MRDRLSTVPDVGTVVADNVAYAASDNAVGLLGWVIEHSDTGPVLAGVQVRIRRKALASDGHGHGSLMDVQRAVHEALGFIRQGHLGGIPVTACWRQVSAPPSVDANGRPVAADTYYVRYEGSAIR